MVSASFCSIEEILRVAEEAGASDVHLSAGTPPRMRTGGVLSAMDAPGLTAADTLDMILKLMPEAQRKEFEEQGEYDFAFSIPNLGRYRASVYRQRNTVALAIRLVGAGIPSLEKLGAPESVTNLCRLSQGLVLVAGASGSGKSATLAAMIDDINDNRDAMVITLEKPIEHLHGHKKSIVDQREIGPDSKSYASALRAALREDPDVIMVGDVCDAETADGVLAAAGTGHLVFSGICAAGTVDAVECLIDFWPHHRRNRVCERLADVLQAVVFQKMHSAGGDRRVVFEVLSVDTRTRELIRKMEMKNLSV